MLRINETVVEAIVVYVALLLGSEQHLAVVYCLCCLLQ